MNKWIARACALLLLPGIAYAQEIPTFKKQIIQVPMNTVDWVWPYWKDIDKDGLTDLSVLVHNENKAFTYIQSNSGFPEIPTQTITFPTATMWFTLFDVDEHHGDEMLISTSEGLVYYRQNNGVFEIKPEKLIEAKQIIPKNHPPIIKEPDKWPDDSKNTLPLVFPDHTVIYEVNDNYQLNVVRTVKYEFRQTMDKFNWNSWNIGSKKSDQLRIRTTAQKKPETNLEKDTKKENEYIKKTIRNIKKHSRWWGDHGIEEKDINADGSIDLTLWYSSGDINAKTTIIVFIRQQNGTLSEKPNQILRCSGMPINSDNQSRSISLFYDIDNDGVLEIVLAELKTKPISASSFVEIAVSKGIDWILSIRRFKKSGEYPNKADFKLSITTMLPLEQGVFDLINFNSDFNGDGYKDLMARCSPVRCDIYLSSATKDFYDPQPKLQLEIPEKGQTFIENLNSDGISDIYVIDYIKGRITLFLSEPLKKKGAL